MTSSFTSQLQAHYHRMLEAYGPQGWWPLVRVQGENPTKTGSLQGYHPGDYTYPQSRADAFEICIGAILTQNTAWPNVEKALCNLAREGLLDPIALCEAPEELLKTSIRPAGFFNQKARYLQIFANWFREAGQQTPARTELLSLTGVGEETADSMLLYAFRQPEFVVDTYTRRWLAAEGLMTGRERYGEIKSFFETNLASDVTMFQEFHALIIEEGKRRRLSKGASIAVAPSLK